MKIRPAQEDDASQLIPLLEQMQYKMDLEQMKQRIAAFNSKGHQLLIAEEDNKIIALIAFGCYELFRLPGCCVHIDTLVVDKVHRGKKIGQKLVAFAEKYAAEQGAIDIELISANHRKADGTHAFYEAIGYKNHIALDCAYFLKSL